MVRIGAPDGFGNVFLAPRVRALTDRHPELEIEILASARLFSLLKREADIAIGHSSPEQMRLVSRRLTDFRMYVYASRAYLEAASAIVTRQDLKKHPFIGFIEEVFAAEDYSDAIGADIKPRIRSTSILAQLHATLSGSGLCMLPASSHPATQCSYPCCQSKCRLRCPFTCTFMKIIDELRTSGRLRLSSQRKSSVAMLSS